MTTSVSLLGFTLPQSQRLQSLNTELQNLQRQLASGKKEETFSGFGTDAFRIQDLRAQAELLEQYEENTNRVQTRIEVILNTTQEINQIADQVDDSILLQTREGEVDLVSIGAVADTNLRYLQDLLNVQDGTRFLLAGTDAQNPPFQDAANLEFNFQQEINAWLAGTQTTQQTLDNIAAFTDQDLGLSAGVSAAQGVNTRIDDSVTVDYTVKANEDGFKNLIRGFALADNIRFPDPAVDIATEADFYELLDGVRGFITEGTEQVNALSVDLATENNLINNVRENNERDLSLTRSLIDEFENTDATEVIVQLQTLETQLNASYQVTTLLSDLSLVNFLR